MIHNIPAKKFIPIMDLDWQDMTGTPLDNFYTKTTHVINKSLVMHQTIFVNLLMQILIFTVAVVFNNSLVTLFHYTTTLTHILWIKTTSPTSVKYDATIFS